MIVIHTYYDILQIPSAATVDEIKRAYRRRAKELHPDRNKSYNAQEQFVLLNEAYEYLIHVKTSGNSAYSNPTEYYWSEQEWREQQRENAKVRAREFARMRYEEYIKSDHYKEQVIVDVVTVHLGIFVSAILLFIFPIVALYYGGSSAWGPILVVVVLLAPFHMKSYQNLQRANSTTFASSFVALVKMQWFQLAALTIFNLVILLRIGWHTLIEPKYLLLSIGCVAVLFYFIFNNKLYYFGIGPSLISMFLLLNFVFSTAAAPETYTLQRVLGGTRDNTLIHIEDDVYNEFIGIRVFMEYSEVRSATKVVYYFNDGLFGFKVLKDYKLISDDSYQYIY